MVIMMEKLILLLYVKEENILLQLARINKLLFRIMIYLDALRTGPGMYECDRIIQTIEHFYDHIHIECVGHLGLTSIEYKENVEPRKQEIIDFCKNI